MKRSILSLIIITHLITCLSVSGADVNDLISQLYEKINVQKNLQQSDPDYQANYQTIDRIKSELISLGDESIEPILEFIRAKALRNEYFYTKIAEILKGINSDKSQNMLLDIALRKSSVPIYPNVAASFYASNAKDPNKVIKLLASDQPDIVDTALQYCVGIRIDNTLLEKLGEYILDDVNFRTYHKWLRVARIIKMDPGEQYAREKIKILTNSFNKLNELPKMHELKPGGRPTPQEKLSLEMIDTLIIMKGSPRYLEKFTPRQNTILRTCFIIARAYHNDVGVKEELKHIIHNPNGIPDIRKAGLKAFAEIGTKEDINFLTDIADNDPLRVIYKGGPRYFLINDKIINYSLPANVLPEEKKYVEEEDKKWILSNGSVSYYLRPIAKHVIQEIADKESRITK